MTEIMEQQGKVPIPWWISAKGEIDINSTDEVHRALLRIKQKLNKYPHGPPMWDRQIHLNTVFVGDRKPVLVSIGQNYQDPIKPDVMEAHKLKYLRDFVERTDTNVEELLRAAQSFFKIVAIFDLEGQSDPEVLMERWILDGCFVIELFLKNDEGEHGLLFESEWILYILNRDLILIDNQMSGSFFKILIDVCSLSKKSNQDYDDKLKHFCWLARKFLERIVPNQKLYQPLADTDRQFEDLLSIVYDGLNWPLSPQANYNKVELVGDDKWNSVKSATKLKELGVEFKMIETDNFVDIKFIDKVLNIPRIRIRHGTPYCIKVLVEYEQSHRQSRYLNNYLWFMNSLVKSPTDVQLLCQKGIIDNLSELSDDAAIHGFLKNLSRSLAVSLNNFSYVQLCMDLNSHYSERQNTWNWMAKLRRDFNARLTKFKIGGCFMLVFALVQTVFTVVSSFKGK